MLFRSIAVCLRGQLNSNVRLHSRRSRAVLQQSQRLRREPNTTTRQEPRETGQHGQALSSGALSRPKTKTTSAWGPCEQRALRQQHEEAAAAHARQASPHQLRTRSAIGCHGALRAVLQPTKLRTRSVIGSHGALRRHIHGMLVVILMQANHVSVQPNNSFKLSPNGRPRYSTSLFLLPRGLPSVPA